MICVETGNGRRELGVTSRLLLFEKYGLLARTKDKTTQRRKGAESVQSGLKGVCKNKSLRLCAFASLGRNPFPGQDTKSI